MPEFTLPRTGWPTVVLTGRRLASAQSPGYRKHEESPRARCMWFTADVYETAKGKYVLALSFRYSGKLSRESEQDIVEVWSTLEDVCDFLESFDPMICVTGYPPGDYWVPKQALLAESIKEDFDILVERVEDALAKLSEPERIE